MFQHSIEKRLDTFCDKNKYEISWSILIKRKWSVPIFHDSWKHLCEMKSRLIPLLLQSVDYGVCCLGNFKLVLKETSVLLLVFLWKSRITFSYFLNISTFVSPLTGLKWACFLTRMACLRPARLCVCACVKSGLFLRCRRSL